MSEVNLSMLWDDQNMLLITDAAIYAIDDALDGATWSGLFLWKAHPYLWAQVSLSQPG